MNLTACRKGLQNLVHAKLKGLKQIVFLPHSHLPMDLSRASPWKNETNVLRCFKGLPLERVIVVTAFRGAYAWEQSLKQQLEHLAAPTWARRRAWESVMERMLLGQTEEADDAEEES